MTRPLTLRHVPPAEPPTRPAMANARDHRPDVGLTSRWVERHGRPAVPVSGEIHYSRLPRHRWAERLRLLRSGGVTVASTYVLWAHHEREPGRPRFDGRLDVGAFVDECAAAGLDVMLRIGPWVHAEARHGGFPDHVQAAPVAHRTDDPAYLGLVRGWWTALAGAVADRCGPAGPVIGLQIENELYDQPGHLATLVDLAREVGFHAPVWTATAWGSAQLPPDVLLPVYGGYVDGFWVDAGAPWDLTFRSHVHFSQEWDDPGIGADLRVAPAPARSDAGRAGIGTFPAVTCELGGGMATAYHRRPWPSGQDLATVAHVKVGSGSAWQGYYMFAGGTNPGPGLQESQTTGYPNDLPVLDYDFHAPVGAAGVLAPSHAALRRQHAALAAFGDRLAPMTSTLPDLLPHDVTDAATLRWAVRADDTSGVLAVAWHQPHEPLAPVEGVRFRVDLAGTGGSGVPEGAGGSEGTEGTEGAEGWAGARLELPSAPATFRPGTLALWPLRWTVGGATVEWATASLLTELPATADRPAVLVLVEDAGIDAEIAVPVGGALDVRRVTPGAGPVELDGPDGPGWVVVLPAAQADRLWVQDPRPGTGARRRLLRSPDTLGWGADGVLHVLTDGAGQEGPDGHPEVAGHDGTGWRPVPLVPAGPGARRDAVVVEQVRPAGAVPVSYASDASDASDGSAARRAPAPGDADVDRLAARHRLVLPDWSAEPSDHLRLHVRWAGDVARLLVDGRVVADRFWDGAEWVVELRDHDVRPGSVLELRLLPLHPDAPVHLPEAARGRRGDAARGTLDAVVLRRPGAWVEDVGPDDGGGRP